MRRSSRMKRERMVTVRKHCGLLAMNCSRALIACDTRVASDVVYRIARVVKLYLCDCDADDFPVTAAIAAVVEEEPSANGVGSPSEPRLVRYRSHMQRAIMEMSPPLYPPLTRHLPRDMYD